MSDSLSDKGTGKWAPHLLVVFLKELVSSRVKVNALSQCIVQAARPQTAVLPVPLSVTVSIDNVCGSSELIIESARLGLCVSYDELLQFKQSVIVTRDACDKNSQSAVGAPHMPSYDVSEQMQTPQFTQFIADNVDHDIRTIDGRGRSMAWASSVQQHMTIVTNPCYTQTDCKFRGYRDDSRHPLLHRIAE